MDRIIRRALEIYRELAKAKIAQCAPLGLEPRNDRDAKRLEKDWRLRELWQHELTAIEVVFRTESPPDPVRHRLTLEVYRLREELAAAHATRAEP